MRLAFLFGTLIMVAGLMGSPQATPVPENAPDGLRFLDSGPTLQALTLKVQADISWRDQDGAALFLWSDSSPKPDQLHFRLNRAYFIRQKGRTVWAFLDNSSAQNLGFNDPVSQFLLRRHVLQRVESGANYGDGNHSGVELVERSGDGSIVLKIDYASNSGERAEQEEIRTYLLYKSPSGRWQLATHDVNGTLGGGSYKNGWIAVYTTPEFRIMLTPGGPAPFRVELKNLTYFSQGNNSDVSVPGYATFREGALLGPFPLKLQISNQDILRPSGTETLRSLAQTLTAYRSEWVAADWVNSPLEAKRQVESLWVDALQRANPGFSPDEIILPNMRVIIPNDAARAIFDQLKDNFVFGK